MASTRASRDRALTGGLAILAVAQFLIALDYSVVYIALPSIAADLGLGETTMQWVVSGYAVFFAGFLIVGGRASDRFGPRRLFIWALVLFGVASLAGGLAEGPVPLLVARAGQGVAAAILQPATLALINTRYEPGPERNRALSVWGTIGASGLAAGVVLGGLLTSASWRWVFIINLPLALLAGAAAPWLLAKGGAAEGRRTLLNVPSAVLCTGTVLSAALALTEAAGSGWVSTPTMAALATAVVLLVLFVMRERSSAEPLVAPALRRTRTLVVGCGATALYMASVGNQFFVLTLLLQQGRDYGPLAAGLAFLPMAVAIAAANGIAGRVVRALGVRTALTLAFTVDALGLILLTVQIHGDGYVLNLLPGLLITGVGHGVTYICMFIAGTQDVAAGNQGVGAALMTTSQFMSGALGIAVLVLILGASPDDGRFAWAFVATAVAAVLGAVLAWFGLRPASARGPSGPAGAANAGPREAVAPDG